MPLFFSRLLSIQLFWGTCTHNARLRVYVSSYKYVFVGLNLMCAFVRSDYVIRVGACPRKEGGLLAHETNFNVAIQYLIRYLESDFILYEVYPLVIMMPIYLSIAFLRLITLTRTMDCGNRTEWWRFYLEDLSSADYLEILVIAYDKILLFQHSDIEIDHVSR